MVSIESRAVTCSFQRWFSRWVTPLASGPSSPESSNLMSYSDMACKLHTFTFTFTQHKTHPAGILYGAARPKHYSFM